MNRIKQHKSSLYLLLKGILFMYMTTFFINDNLIITLVKNVDDDYELLEDFGEGDAEEREYEDEEESDKNLMPLAIQVRKTHTDLNVNSFIRENFSCYLVYQREIPYPPPDFC